MPPRTGSRRVASCRTLCARNASTHRVGRANVRRDFRVFVSPSARTDRHTMMSARPAGRRRDRSRGVRATRSTPAVPPSRPGQQRQHDVGAGLRAVRRGRQRPRLSEGERLRQASGRRLTGVSQSRTTLRLTLSRACARSTDLRRIDRMSRRVRVLSVLDFSASHNQSSTACPTVKPLSATTVPSS